MVVVLVSQSRAPGSRVPVDGGAAGVGDAHVVEREHASRPCRWPVVGQTAGTAYVILFVYALLYCPIDKG